MSSKKPGIGSWEDNPYVTRNERRRNKKPSPVQVVAPPPKPTTPRVIPIKPVQKAASPDKEVRPQPPKELEPIVKEAPKKTTVKKEKKEKVTKTTPETEPLKELEPVQEPEPVPEPVQKPEIVPKPIQEPEPVKELVPELVQEQEPVKELDAELCHINPRHVMEPREGSVVSIYCDKKANPEALRAVLDQKGIRELPLVVIPVAGEYRGGKSFLLSYFIRYLTNQNFGDEDEELVGFIHKRSSAPVTQGIDIWDKPLIVNRSGEKIVVLLMDSQGILGRRQDSEVAKGIFALSTLLSSIMVFNLKSQINEGIWNYLHLFISYANQLTAENETGRPFQKLMILIRDWQNGDVFGYKGGEQYLADHFGDDENTIDPYFSHNSCYLMPPPGSCVGDGDYNGCLRELRGDFKKSMKELIIELCNPDQLAKYMKNVDGNNITAGQFCDYFESCTSMLSNVDWNTDTNIVKMNADFTCESAKKDAVKEYCLIMDKKTDSFIKTVTESSEGDFGGYDRNARREAKRKYDEIARNSKRNEPQLFDAHRLKLNGELDEKYARYLGSLRKMMLLQSIREIEEAKRVFENIDEAMEDIIDEMSKVQTRVRGTKGVNAAVLVGSAIAVFTPLAPLAAAGLIGTSLLGAGTSVLEFALNRSAQNRIEGYASKAKKHLKQARIVVGNFMKMEAVAKSSAAAAAGFALISIADDVIAAAGKSLLVVPILGLAMSGFGVAYSLADAVESQLKENLSIGAARQLQVQIKDIIKDLNKQIVVLEARCKQPWDDKKLMAHSAAVP